MARGDGDQVFTGRDTFDFGTSRRDAERIMKMRTPFVVVSEEAGRTPFLGRREGQRWLAGAVVAAYWGAPIARGIARRNRRRRNRSADGQ